MNSLLIIPAYQTNHSANSDDDNSQLIVSVEIICGFFVCLLLCCSEVYTISLVSLNAARNIHRTIPKVHSM